MLKFDDITIEEWREPPRSQHTLPARRDTHHRTFDSDGLPGEVIVDMGQDTSRLLRIASGETVGFLTWQEVQGLEELYAEGIDFDLTWDRLSAHGAGSPSNTTVRARFDGPPVFTLANEQIDLWFMDLMLRVWPEGGS